MNSKGSERQFKWGGDRDWPTGNYLCKCYKCGKEYAGPKRSLMCHLCIPKKETVSEDPQPQSESGQGT